MRRRLRRGLTLIETLVVLTIAAILIAVLLTVLFPSDARRCRLEAERLAAWMMAASAESVMRDAPVRVVVDIGSGTVRREVTRVGASITEDLWERDDKAEVFEVESPVRIDAVDSAASQELHSGTGYVIFRGEQTEGAAVVLGVEEIFYTVVVPASGGAIEVLEGRHARPAGKPGLDRSLNAFNQPLDTGGELGNLKEGSIGGLASGVGAGFSPPAARGATRTPTRTNNDTNNNNQGNDSNDTPNETPQTPSTPTPPISKPPPPPPPDPPPPEPEVPVEPQIPPPATGFGGCSVESDCGGPGGWATCVDGQCVADGVGNVVRLRTARLVSPNVAGVTAVVNQAVGAQVGVGQLNLLVYFGSDRSWIVQADRDGEVQTADGRTLKRYRQSGSLPTYAGDQVADQALTCDYSDRSCTSTVEVGGGVKLFIPDPFTDADCPYQILEILPTLTVDFTVSSNLLQLETAVANRPQIELRAVVTRAAARKIRVNETQTLDTLLMDSRPLGEPSDDVVDVTGDGDADGWLFVFRGDAEEVRFINEPYADPQVAPEECN